MASLANLFSMITAVGKNPDGLMYTKQISKGFFICMFDVNPVLLVELTLGLPKILGQGNSCPL